MRLALLASLLLSTSVFAAVPKKLSVEFVNADVHSILRLFAEVGHFNLVTSEEVSGKVTMSLRNVPWDDALHAVLASKGLGLERLGSIYRVAPLSKLTEEALARTRAEEALVNSKPLKTTLIAVNYANAEAMAQHVKALLSARGTVSVDARTNTLIVRDVEQ